MSAVPRSGRPWNQRRRRNKVVAPPAIQPGGEGQQVLVAVRPVEPGDLVVLAVGVVVAALRAAHLVAVEQHRHPLRQQQGGQQVALLAGPQRQDVRIVGRALDAAVPRPVVVSPSLLPSPLASLCFSLYETRSARVKPSWAVTKLTLAEGRRESAWYRSELPVSRDAISPTTAARPATRPARCRGTCRSTPTTGAGSCPPDSRPRPGPRARR